MLTKVLIGVALAVCLLGASHVHAACSEPLVARYDRMDSLVQSLHADKPGAARVYVRDGSEFTGGQVWWMRGQMMRVARLCASGSAQDQELAAQPLGEVEELVRSHRRSR